MGIVVASLYMASSLASAILEPRKQINIYGDDADNISSEKVNCAFTHLVPVKVHIVELADIWKYYTTGSNSPTLRLPANPSTNNGILLPGWEAIARNVSTFKFKYATFRYFCP